MAAQGGPWPDPRGGYLCGRRHIGTRGGESTARVRHPPSPAWRASWPRLDGRSPIVYLAANESCADTSRTATASTGRGAEAVEGVSPFKGGNRSMPTRETLTLPSSFAEKLWTPLTGLAASNQAALKDTRCFSSAGRCKRNNSQKLPASEVMYSYSSELQRRIGIGRAVRQPRAQKSELGPPPTVFNPVRWSYCTLGCQPSPVGWQARQPGTRPLASVAARARARRPESARIRQGPWASASEVESAGGPMGPPARVARSTTAVRVRANNCCRAIQHAHACHCDLPSCVKVVLLGILSDSGTSTSTVREEGMHSLRSRLVSAMHCRRTLQPAGSTYAGHHLGTC